jgi:ribosome-interacting GTPase 1
MARTHKNKATNYHLGTLKAKLAKLRNDLLVEQGGGSGSAGAGEGFDVARLGDARVALIGFPSVGKSTLLGALTTTESETVCFLNHKSKQLLFHISFFHFFIAI